MFIDLLISSCFVCKGTTFLSFVTLCRIVVPVTVSVLLQLLLSFHYYFSFFWGEAVEVEDAGVYLLVGLVDLLSEGFAGLGVVAKVWFPLVLLNEGKLYLLLLQLCRELSKGQLIKGQNCFY